MTTTPASDRYVTKLDNGRLKSFIERIEHIESDIDNWREDRESIYAEAKGSGFDVKVMRKLVLIRKQDAARRREEEELLDLYKASEELLDLYMASLGMV